MHNIYYVSMYYMTLSSCLTYPLLVMMSSRGVRFFGSLGKTNFKSIPRQNTVRLIHHIEKFIHSEGTYK